MISLFTAIQTQTRYQFKVLSVILVVVGFKKMFLPKCQYIRYYDMEHICMKVNKSPRVIANQGKYICYNGRCCYKNGL